MRHRGTMGILRHGLKPSHRRFEPAGLRLQAVMQGLKGAGFAALLAAAACVPQAEVDADENDPAKLAFAEALFDPAAGAIPLPSRLLFGPDNTLDLPASCGESEAQAQVREGVLNQLNGFGLYKSAIQFSVNRPIDVTSLKTSGEDANVLLFEMNDPTAAPIPMVLAAAPAQTPVLDDACAATGVEVTTITLVPAVPLKENTNYAVALLQGLQDEDGEAFLPSATWSLVRLRESPVVVDFSREDLTGVDSSQQLVKFGLSRNETPFDPFTLEGASTILGLDLLWKAHEPALGFLDAALGVRQNQDATNPPPRSDITLAWWFTTQSTVSALEPLVDAASTTGTNDTAAGAMTAAQLGLPDALVDTSMDGSVSAPELMEAALCGAQGDPPGCGACNLLPCAAVGALNVGSFTAPNYQTTQKAGELDVPGAFATPNNPVVQGNNTILYNYFEPALPAPAAGYPVVIFAHGITRSRNDVFAIASQFNGAGIAVIAFDWTLHGARLINIKGEGECAADATPPPSMDDTPYCFQPIFSPDLATTRDNFRQSAVEMSKLVAVLKACGAGSNTCVGLNVDSSKIGYIGHSLGSMIGVPAVALNADIKAAVFNVGGVGWVDVIQNTGSTEFRCSLVDGLIGAGVLEGIVHGPEENAEALCLTETWKTDPAYLRFASAGRWVLDPANGPNFVADMRAGSTHILLQEVLGDNIVPNASTTAFGGLLGLEPQAANINGGVAAPSADVATPSTVAPRRTWLQYGGDAANFYDHSSLLEPASAEGSTDVVPGGLALTQMQTDAITFLVTQLQN